MENIEFDLSKLRGRIREILGSEQEYQRKMGFSNFKRDHRLNGKSYFSQDEIQLTCKLLSIEPNEIPEYFFKIKVRKTEQM